MDLKIIYIIEHPQSYEAYGAQRPEANWNIPGGSWVAIWGDEWGNFIGNNIRKFHPEVAFEVWQPDFRADKVYSHTFTSGVVHKLFPSQWHDGEISSDAMMSELAEEVHLRANQLIIQIDGMKNLITEIVLDRFSRKVPVLTQFLGTLSFVLLHLDFRIWRWPQRYYRRERLLKFIREKQKYIAFSELLPLEPVFRTKVGTPNHRIFNLAIGIEDEYFSDDHEKRPLREKWNIPVGNTVFLSSSRLDPLKQVNEVIKAFSQVKSNNCTLLITGGGPEGYVKKLKRSIKNQDKDIRLLGFISEAELLECFQLSDVFVDASQNDGGPIGGWKAMGMNLGVITTATGNVGKFLHQFNAGEVISINDHDSWVAVFEAVTSGKQDIARIPVQEVKKVKGWVACARNFVNIYTSVIEDFHGIKTKTTF